MDDIQNKELQPLMVSIKCLAYNHGKFIRETLEGFVMQKTNFRFEAIVHDDASTDNTAEIIREYAEKYPEIIKPIYETENQYSKKDGSLQRIMDEACNGKYIAFCEGDDYWTDPYKLQKQVDFLETHPDYVMCSHFYREYVENEKYMCTYVKPFFSENSFSLYDYIKGKWFAQPLTVVYRKSAFNIEEYLKYGMFYDVIWFYMLLKKGKCWLMPETMAVYRIHSGGVWSHLNSQDQNFLEIKQRLAIYEAEKTEISVDFILNTMLQRGYSRFLLVKNFFLVLKVLYAICKYKGMKICINLIKKKFLYL